MLHRRIFGTKNSWVSRCPGQTTKVPIAVPERHCPGQTTKVPICPGQTTKVPIPVPERHFFVLWHGRFAYDRLDVEQGGPEIWRVCHSGHEFSPEHGNLSAFFRRRVGRHAPINFHVSFWLFASDPEPAQEPIPFVEPFDGHRMLLQMIDAVPRLQRRRTVQVGMRPRAAIPVFKMSSDACNWLPLSTVQ